MTEATIEQPQTAAGVIAKPSSNGNVQVLIGMNNIWKTYDMGAEKVHALHGVSFEVRRGEYLAIIGPSGSGKSTLMNLIGCLDTPSSGEYWLNGKNVSEMDDDELARIRNQEVGFISRGKNFTRAHADLEDRRSTGDGGGDRHVSHDFLGAAPGEPGEERAGALDAVLGIAG